MEIDRREFFTWLGGTAVAAAMTHEARADALEEFMEEKLDAAVGGQQAPPAPEYPSMEEAFSLDGRSYRRGTGRIFTPGRGEEHLTKLHPLPEKPTLVDYFKYRFAPANHVLQSANRALQTGMSETVVLACLLHDVVHALMRPDHGYWGAQLVEPYVPETVSWGIRYHQALRFYPDEEAGYVYPESYYRTFGFDYEPPPYIEAAYKYARNHKWYMESRLITVNDLYAFDRNAEVSIEPFIDIIGRHFKQPKEGLGYDNSPVAHMWRTIANPDMPL